MNILFYLTKYPSVGGIENVTNIIASELIKEHNISVMSHISQVAPVVNGITIYRMPNAQVWSAKENYEYAEKIVSDNQFDAIIYQDSYAPTEKIACGIAECHNIPLYVFEHNSPLFIYNKRDLDPITTPKGLLRRLLHPYLLHKEIKRKRYLLEHCAKYVLLSKQFIPEFCNLTGIGINDSRITYINNPAVEVATKMNVPKENIILCVSRLAQEKCIDKMVRMWSELSSQLQEWHFIIVGDGPERDNLETMVHKMNVPRVEFTGFARPTDFYQRAKIFWMTSKYEGWGMTLIEAMQQGCVPVAFKTFSSIIDIIDDGQNGYLVAPEDMHSFRDRSFLLANDGTLRSVLAESAKKKGEEFALSHVIDKWNKLLKIDA